MKATRGIINKIVHWEAWPFELLYLPLAIFWIWYIIKSRSVWFFTSSNPGLTFGGLEGEPKKEMYDLLPPGSYPPTFNVLPGEPITSIRAKLATNGIGYPFIVKPEVGGQGILLRKIDDEEALLLIRDALSAVLGKPIDDAGDSAQFSERRFAAS